MRRGRFHRVICWPLAAAAVLTGTPARAAAREATVGGLNLRVVEVARTMDLDRNEPFFTITLDVTAKGPGSLRQVQPYRDDFQLLAGKKSLPCRWLRGGSLPNDPKTLRFTLGFTPPSGVKAVDLRANVPQLDSREYLEVLIPEARGNQDVPGAGASLRVLRFEEQPFDPPSLPPNGTFVGKLGPGDVRVFYKASPKDAPARAVEVAIFSRDPQLFDTTLDVSGTLTVDGGPATALIAARMQREPTRTHKAPEGGPLIQGQFYFTVPPRGRPAGAVLRFHRRSEHPASRTVTIRGLPVAR